jgi:photosystem II stability/assembly factor-like uncharacterized protein
MIVRHVVRERRVSLAAVSMSLVLVFALSSVSRPCYADGAFPDELQIFLPAEQPHEIVLAANFGLLLSQDDGATWNLVCEAMISSSALVNVYQLGPDDALFAGFGSTVAHSTDHGCTWSNSQGLAPKTARDFFADPSDASRIYALGTGVVRTDSSGIYISTDEASTFGTPTDVEPASDLNGLEVARSNGQSVYATGSGPSLDGGSQVTFLLFSNDRGSSWTRIEHPELGEARLAIAAVDPLDANTLYLRSGLITQTDSLQISHDQGRTLGDALDLTESMSGFARADDGTLYVGSRVGHLWVRAPNATSFTQGTGPLIRCLGTRGASLFACGDNSADGFALGRSDDQGHTFQKVLAYADVQGLASCSQVQSACASAWQSFQQIFPPSSKSKSSSSSSKSKGCGCMPVDGGDVDQLFVLVAAMGLMGRRGLRQTPPLRPANAQPWFWLPK